MLRGTVGSHSPLFRLYTWHFPSVSDENSGFLNTSKEEELSVYENYSEICPNSRDIGRHPHTGCVRSNCPVHSNRSANNGKRSKRVPLCKCKLFDPDEFSESDNSQYGKLDSGIDECNMR